MWCLTLIVSISARTVTCVEQNIIYPIAIPKTNQAISKGTWGIKSILYKPKAFYNKRLSSSVIGNYVFCLDKPNRNACFHGWSDTSVLGKRVSSECYRLSLKDMEDLWKRTLISTKVIIN